MLNIQKHLSLLGLKVKDRVTGFRGVVVSVGFDLYGCVQAIVNPGADKEAKPRESQWFDVNRLEVLDKKPVMNQPNFEFGHMAEGKKGACEKPAGARAAY